MDHELSRPGRALVVVVAIYGASALVAGILARALGLFSPESSLAVGGFRLAAAAVSLLALGATTWLVLRGSLLELGSVLVAAMLGSGLAGWGLTQPAMLPDALESTGGAALIGAVLVLKRPRLRRPDAGGPKKVHLVRPGGRTAVVALEALGPSDRARVAPGELVPADGLLAGARAAFAAPGIRRSPPVVREHGEPVLAGWTPDVEVDVLVERAPRDGLGGLRAGIETEVGRSLARPSGAERGLAILVGALAAIAFGARLGYGPPSPLAGLVADAAALALAAAVGAPALAGARRRVAALRRLGDGGVVITRAPDLAPLLEANRWQLDPRLLAAPGGVEVVPLDDTPRTHLLALAAALLAERDHPDRAAIERAARERGAASLRGAGFASRGAVVMGTVGGTRWHLGPRDEVERGSGIRVPRDLEGTLGFLAERGRRVLLLASPDRGVSAALGVETQPEPTALEVGRALKAEIAPGLSEPIRAELAHKSGLALARSLGGRSICVLLDRDSPPPSGGLGVRVIPLLVGLELPPGSPRILAPALRDFPVALDDARNLVARGAFRVLAPLAPPLLAGGVAVGGFLLPAAGVALGLSAVVWGTRLDRDAAEPGPSRPALEPEPAIDVTLGGIEAVVPSSVVSDEPTVSDDGDEGRRTRG